MNHGTCVAHVRLCMLGSLTLGGGDNVPGIPGACATRNVTYLARGSCSGPLLCQMSDKHGTEYAGWTFDSLPRMVTSAAGVIPFLRNDLSANILLYALDYSARQALRDIWHLSGWSPSSQFRRHGKIKKDHWHPCTWLMLLSALLPCSYFPIHIHQSVNESCAMLQFSL